MPFISTLGVDGRSRGNLLDEEPLTGWTQSANGHARRSLTTVKPRRAFFYPFRRSEISRPRFRSRSRTMSQCGGTRHKDFQSMPAVGSDRNRSQKRPPLLRFFTATTHADRPRSTLSAARFGYNLVTVNATLDAHRCGRDGRARSPSSRMVPPAFWILRFSSRKGICEARGLSGFSKSPARLRL